MTAEASETIAARVLEAAAESDRFVVAIAGPPGAGKSTLAAQLRLAVDRLAGDAVSAIVALDGFHYDNAVLDARGVRARKGAAFTFDVAGYRALIERIRHGGGSIGVPVFDRALDLARAGADLVESRHRIVITEGNYLLLDEEPWKSLAGCFDLTIRLDVERSVLEERLIARWLSYGLDRRMAEARARDNDLVNATQVEKLSRAADWTLTLHAASDGFQIIDD